MIEFRDVTRRFGDIEAVKDLNFSVEKGDVVGLLGANGAGKTTTMRLMTGYFPPSEGEVRIGGQLVQRNPLSVKRRIGYLPEIPPLYDEMIVCNYLRYIATLKEVPSDQVNRKIEKVLDRLELQEQVDRVIDNLSRGYRQRVALAQALVHEPDILVLDEPTLGLDPKQVRRLRELIQELAQDSTLIISSHILPEVREICERVIILREGRMAAVDTPEKLASEIKGGRTWTIEVSQLKSSWEDHVREMTELGNFEKVADNEYQISFTENDREAREQLFEISCREDVPILSLEQAELDLEEIFLELTTEEEEIANDESA